jgi:hypothetical protein
MYSLAPTVFVHLLSLNVPVPAVSTFAHHSPDLSRVSIFKILMYSLGATAFVQAPSSNCPVPATATMSHAAEADADATALTANTASMLNMINLILVISDLLIRNYQCRAGCSS